MKRAYIRTDFSYLLWCIPIFLCMIVFTIFLFMINANPLNGPVMAIATFLYGYYLIKSLIETTSRRREQREVIENGRCIRTRVKNLIQIKYDECYIDGAGNTFQRKAYCIEAVSYDSYGNEVVYRSDMIYRRRAKHIPSVLLVYEYCEKTCFVWEDTTEKTSYPIVKSDDIIKGYDKRLKLMEITYILLCVAAINIFSGIVLGVLILLRYFFHG